MYMHTAHLLAAPHNLHSCPPLGSTPALSHPQAAGPLLSPLTTPLYVASTAALYSPQLCNCSPLWLNNCPPPAASGSPECGSTAVYAAGLNRCVPLTSSSVTRPPFAQAALLHSHTAVTLTTTSDEGADNDRRHGELGVNGSAAPISNGWRRVEVLDGLVVRAVECAAACPRPFTDLSSAFH